METYCASSKKRTANKNSSVRKTKKTDECFPQSVLFVFVARKKNLS